MVQNAGILRSGLVAATAIAGLLACSDSQVQSDRVDFVADVEPILRENCYECHGADEQEGGMRWDARLSVLRGGDSGPALSPGNSDESLLIELVTSSDEDERMPQDADPLGPSQIETLRQWIDEGADWPEGIGVVLDDGRSHWAYQKPVRPEPPAVQQASWPRNEIDRFMLARMEAAGLSPAPTAERARLLRRVHLDLVGLPPSVEEVDAFLADDSPDAYEKVVDSLLASPHYGERWAIPWLDSARYADSHGFQADNLRESWSYRDWVIDALNHDMPFDQFTIEQIAGDLLQNATEEQRIATGFHRNATTNIEAGVDPEEGRVSQIIDRVNVTGAVWLGSTIECAQCHSHKYDPFTQREYYQLFSYFNNTPIETVLKQMNTAGADFVGPWMNFSRLSPKELKEKEALSGPTTEALVRLSRAQKKVDPGYPRWLAEMEQKVVSKSSASSDLPKPLRDVLAASARGTSPGYFAQLLLKKHFYDQFPRIRVLKEKLDEFVRLNERFAYGHRSALVMVEDTPRESHVMKRGSFLDLGERVFPGTPDVLHPMPESASADRLGLAQWLVSPDNPLVARVTVNRSWAEFFGRAIVTTPEDFGTRGERPTHPLLLDWLAVDFMEGGWSMKRLHKQIVMSATYRQASQVSPEIREKDPMNALYARGPRFRLPAELVRDNALAVSGLLEKKLHGPPVYPPQPDGLWRLTGDVKKTPYTESEGTERYRRGLYTVWRRSSPYPSFTNFDAPDRSTTCLARSRTNTALQALNLLNDPAYVEAAVALARRIHDAPGAEGVPEKVRFAMRLVLAREPTSSERQRLEALYEDEVARFGAAPEKVNALLEPWGVNAEERSSELAAWFFVANALLNLDETITKS